MAVCQFFAPVSCRQRAVSKLSSGRTTAFSPRTPPLSSLGQRLSLPPLTAVADCQTKAKSKARHVSHPFIRIFLLSLNNRMISPKRQQTLRPMRIPCSSLGPSSKVHHLHRIWQKTASFRSKLVSSPSPGEHHRPKTSQTRTMADMSDLFQVPCTDSFGNDLFVYLLNGLRFGLARTRFACM